MHRNIGNQAGLKDLNCMSVVEYAVTTLKARMAARPVHDGHHWRAAPADTMYGGLCLPCEIIVGDRWAKCTDTDGVAA